MFSKSSFHPAKQFNPSANHGILRSPIRIWQANPDMACPSGIERLHHASMPNWMVHTSRGMAGLISLTSPGKPRRCNAPSKRWEEYTSVSVSAFVVHPLSHLICDQPFSSAPLKSMQHVPLVPSDCTARKHASVNMLTKSHTS